MKLLFTALCLCACTVMGNAQNIVSLSDTAYLQPVELNTVRASDKMPVAKTNLSKKEILERYLNVVQFGKNIFGVKQAAQFYFPVSNSSD